MLLLFPDQSPFAAGSAEYDYNPLPGSDTSARIILYVKVEGRATSAILDTGAPFLVCSPDLADNLGFDPQNALSHHRMNIRGLTIRGTLHRVNLMLPASDGDDLPLEVTAFLPNPEEKQMGYTFPSFLGMYGCLERVRFAVDPFSNKFYFGAHL